MDRNSCNSSFSASVSFAFLIALLNTSINLSTNLFDLRWQGVDFLVIIENNLQILYVNGVPLSNTIVSGNPNLSNSSCISFVVLVIGVLQLKTSGHFLKLSIDKKCVPFIGPA